MALNPDDQFAELWRKAIESYEADTEIKLQTHVLAVCKNPEDVLDALDGELRRFNAYRDKKENLRKWLKPMLNLIDTLSETAGEAAALSFPPGKLVFVALGVLVQAAKDVSERYDNIIALCQHLYSFLERLRVYMSGQLLGRMRELVIQMLAHLLSIFAMVTKEIKRNRFGAFWRSLLNDTTVKDALGKLDNLIEEERSMGIANAMVWSQQILSLVQDLVLSENNVRSTLNALNAKALEANTYLISMTQHMRQDLEKIKKRQLNDSIRSWLKAPDARVNHNTARSLHDDGTGRWLLKLFGYKSWKSASSCFLWLHGKPGAGKTIVCSTVIKDILSFPGSALAYFYFYHGGTVADQSLFGMLSSIISQLEEHLPKDSSPLQKLYEQLEFGAHQPSMKELETCFKDLITALSPRPIFIVLDALDECSEPNKLEPILYLFQSARNTHVFVTSRHENFFIQLLRPLATYQLNLNSLIDRDIDIYLRQFLVKELPFREWAEADRNLVLNYLCKHSDGMFRWVICQLDELSHCIPQNLKQTLEDLPVTLDETYQRTLARIRTTNEHYARVIFHWLALSPRPLLIEEIAQVIAIHFIDDAHAKFEVKDIPKDPAKTILQICLSLVIITPGGTLQFAHRSVKEFLQSKRIRSTSVSQFWIEPEAAHIIIAASCLAYLLWVGYMDDIPTDEDELQEHYPLALYSAEYMVHAQFKGVSQNVHDMLASLFIEDSRPWRFWVSIVHQRDWDDGQRIRVYLKNRPLLSCAARLGFPSILSMLLEDGADVDMTDVNMTDQYWSTPLQTAAAAGHFECAQQLLAYGANVNDPGGGFYGTALQAASSRGHIEIVKFLVERRADVNAQGGGYGTALQVAAFSGRFEVVRFLLDVAQAQGGGLMQTLNRVVVQLLIYINVLTPRDEWTALQAAALGGWVDIVQYLLDRGEEVDAHSANYPTALQAALYSGHINTAHCLLDAAADVNAQGGDYPTALQIALYGGHVDIAKRLLDAGADVNAQGGDYPTALQSAFYGGHIDIATRLLEGGADVNAFKYREDNRLEKRPPRNCVRGSDSLTFRGPFPIPAGEGGNGGGGVSGGLGGPGGVGSFGGRGGRGGVSEPHRQEVGDAYGCMGRPPSRNSLYGGRGGNGGASERLGGKGGTGRHDEYWDEDRGWLAKS